MPIYEYECPKGHHFEVLVPISQHSKTRDCPECNTEAVQTVRPAVCRFKNEKYNTWEPSFERPYAKVNANPWLDDTDR